MNLWKACCTYALVFLVFGAKGVRAETDGDWDYSYSDSDYTAMVYKYRGSSTSPSVPSKFFRRVNTGRPDGNGGWIYRTDTYTVTALEGTFSGNQNITSVSIPSSVKTIGRSTFSGCTSLSEAPIHSGITSIGTGAFYGCTGLKSITTPSSLTSLGSSAFYGCTGLKSAVVNGTGVTLTRTFENCENLESVILGNGVVSMAVEYAAGPHGPFSGCSKLSSLEIGSGVTVIPKDVFRGMSSLQRVVLQGSISTIGDSAFYGCQNLTSIVIPQRAVSQIGIRAFNGCQNLTEVSCAPKTIDYYAFEGCTSLSGGIEFSRCESIGYYAFKGCTAYAFGDLELPAAKTIESGAFEGCTGLTRITTSANLTTLGGASFYGCTGLKSAVINGTGLTLGTSTFKDCENLESVILGNGVTAIITESGGYTYSPFAGCLKLATLEIGTGVTVIPDSLCSGLSGLQRVVLRGAITEIGASAFSGCQSLPSFSFGDTLKTIGNGAFSGCTGLTRITTPESLTLLGSSAFYGCTGLKSAVVNGTGLTETGAFRNCSNLESVILGDGVISIGTEHPFSGCAKLASLEIGMGMTAIPNGVFSGMSSLQRVVLHSPLVQIGRSAFYGCQNLTTVSCAPKTIENVAFDGCTSLSGGIDFSQCESIGQFAFGSCAAYAFGDLDLPSAKMIDISAFSGCTGIMSITTSENLTSLSYAAFSGCTGLKSAVINGTDLTLGARTFKDCENLESVILGDGVISIGTEPPFPGCSKLALLEIGIGMTAVPRVLCYGLSGLQRVVFRGAIAQIGDSAFENCQNLVSISLGGVPKTIGDRAFCNCQSLSEGIDLSQCESIGGSAFGKCSSYPFGELDLPSVKSIGNSAFRECTGLTGITTPASLTTLGEFAFFFCTELRSAVVDGTDLTLENSTFGRCENLENVILGNGVTAIDTKSSSPFSGCSKLATLEIGTGVTVIPYSLCYSFGGLPGLQRVVLRGAISEIGGSAFNGCQNLTTVSCAPKAIGNDAFWGCKSLSGGIDLSRCESIGNGAFSGCSAYAFGDLQLPSIKSIDGFAFDGCKGLTGLHLGEGLSSIGWGAFRDCSSLANVWFGGGVPTVVGSSPSPFAGVAPGAWGHYEAEDADEWEEDGVIGADGKWQGLIMQKGCMLRLHRNGWRSTKEEANVENWWYEFGKGEKLPEKPFDRGDCTFYGWSAGTPDFYWDQGLAVGHRLIEDGAVWAPTEGEWTYWRGLGLVHELEGKDVFDLYGVWGTKTTCEFRAEVAKGETLESPLGHHVQILFDDGKETPWHRGGEAVDLKPGWHSFTVRVDEGYEEQVTDWEPTIPSWGKWEWEWDIESSTKKLKFKIPGKYQGDLPWGGEDNYASLELAVLLKSPAEHGWARFVCRGEITESQRRMCPGFPDFDLHNVRIHLQKKTSATTGGAWIDAEPWTGLPLLPGTYRVEFGYSDKYWSLSTPPDPGVDLEYDISQVVEGGWSSRGFLFEVKAGEETRIPVCWRPFGEDGLFVLVRFDGNGGTPEVNELRYLFGDDGHGKGFSELPNWDGPGGLPNAEHPDGWRLRGWQADSGYFMKNLSELEEYLKRTKVSLTLEACWSKTTVAGGQTWEYSEDGGKATVVDGPKNGAVTIPATLDGMTVMAVGSWAFAEQASLLALTVPDSVESIGDGAFSGCSGLASVALGNGVTSIGDGAFAGCASLTSMAIPESVASLGSQVFEGCSSLATLYVPAAWEGTDMLEGAGVPEGCEVVYGGGTGKKPDLGFWLPEGWPAEVFLVRSAHGLEAATEFAAGEAFFLCCALRNSGNMNAEDCHAAARVVDSAGNEVASWCFPPFALWAGEFNWVGEANLMEDGTGLASISEPGEYTLEIILDPEGLIDESDKSDNRQTLTFTVLPPVTQRVTFDANGGTCATKSKTVDIGGTYGTLPVPTNPNGIYKGWWTAPEGGKRVYAGDKVTEAAQRTLYAHWKPTKQTVTFDANGGTCSTKSKTVDIGGTYGTLPVPTNPNGIYKGWWTAPEGGKRVYAGDEVTEAAQRTLYAHWKPTKQTVTFDANGGTCSTKSKTVDIGETYGTLPVPTNPDAIYKGWWTAPEGGKRVYAGDEVTEAAQRTLYAHWKPTKQTVTFDANGGTCSTKSKTVDIGGTYGTLPVPTNPNGIYQGWWTAPEGGKRVYAGEEVPETAQRTLYAHWKPTKQTVTFEANGGTCSTKSKIVDVGGTYGTLPVPTNPNGIYKGWWTAPEGGKRVYAGDEVTEAAQRTLYAHWKPTKQTVTFDANGGTCSTKSKTVDIGETYGTLPVPTNPDGIYKGWWTAPEGGKRVYAGDEVTEAAQRTLYAHWKPTKQTVTFDANGGTCATATKTVDVGGTYGTLPVPKQAGHTYKGWWTEPVGGTRVYAGDEVTEVFQRILYAHWVASKGLSISKFVVKGASGTPGARAASTSDSVLTFEAEAGCTYELQWTPALGGEWTTVHRWTAEADGETSIEVPARPGEATGFYRLAAPDIAGEE